MIRPAVSAMEQRENLTFVNCEYNYKIKKEKNGGRRRSRTQIKQTQIKPKLSRAYLRGVLD